ncbi:CLUMA_CG005122, isoform A [Clunio marinus]|uniref:CLUMA_CG005122, isoform A n=1 Tax=Clunio marinus TaxID=568069 RepID=A0A1J1HTX9_9DIPT|nr:CLUMA_CG005122, isoform A [Clunio marinus]
MYNNAMRMIRDVMLTTFHVNRFSQLCWLLRGIVENEKDWNAHQSLSQSPCGTITANIHILRP